MSINFSSNGKCDLSSLDHTQRPDDLIEARDTIFSAIKVTRNRLFASIKHEGFTRLLSLITAS